MTRLCAIALVSLLALDARIAMAQDLSRYRDYALGSSVTAIVTASAARATDVKSLHERPALIQELDWHALYLATRDRVDSVDRVLFNFYNDKLYQIVVTYDRDRMAGLTDADVVAAVSSTYGAPELAVRAAVAKKDDPFAPSIMVAQWSDAASQLTLTRDVYSRQFQLVLVGKALAEQARLAIKDSVRLDKQDAPGLEREQAAEDALKVETARLANRAAFRP
jgi:hypothetical protein